MIGITICIHFIFDDKSGFLIRCASFRKMRRFHAVDRKNLIAIKENGNLRAETLRGAWSKKFKDPWYRDKRVKIRLWPNVGS